MSKTDGLQSRASLKTMDARSSDDANLGLLVRYTFRSFTRALQAVATAYRVTAAEFRVLRTLSDGGALTQVELASQAAMDRPYAASTVRQLRLKKMIRSVAHPGDGRRVNLLLTARGSHVVEAISKQLEIVNEVAVKGVQPGDYAVFLRVLGQVRQNLEGHGLEGDPEDT